MNIIYLHTSLKKCGPTSQLKTLLSNKNENFIYYLFLIRSPKVQDLNLVNINIISSLFHLVVLVNQLNNKKYIIHSSGILPDILLFFIKIFAPKNLKAFTTVRNIPWEDYKFRFGILGLLLSKFHLLVLKRLTIICCSSTVYKEFKELKFLKNNIYFVDNCFTISAKVNSIKKNKGKLKFLSLSPLIKRKQVLKTISLFKNLELDFHFDIYGNGPQTDEILRSIEGDYRFFFKGYVNNDQLNFQDYDALISLSFSEGLPNSVIESLYNGIFAILSPISSHKYLSNFSKKALILNSFETSNLNKLLNFIVENRNTRIDVERFRNYFGKERMIKEYQKIYEGN